MKCDPSLAEKVKVISLVSVIFNALHLLDLFLCQTLTHLKTKDIVLAGDIVHDYGLDGILWSRLRGELHKLFQFASSLMQ